MRQTLMLLLSAVLAFGSLVNLPNNVAASETSDLTAAITTYRQAFGLDPIPLSPALTAVAKAHVQDLIAFSTTDPNYMGDGCNPHSWSSQGTWSGGCFRENDPTTSTIMWSKPKEIAAYPGNGFEIIFGTNGMTATATDALRGWSQSPPHNDVILNQGIWATSTWRAVGVWVEDGWASVWFGEQADTTPPQAGTAGGNTTGATGGNATGTTDGNTTGITVTFNGNTTGANGNVTGNATGGTTGNATGNATGDAAGATGNTTGNATGNATTGEEKTPPCVDAEELAFLTLINDYRSANGVGPLALSPTLSAAADAHSQDMATNNFLGHTGSNGSTAEQRFTTNGYADFNASGENVFAGNEQAAVAFGWWQNSPGHNANMLSPTFAAIGIGRAFDKDSTFRWYWTTTFGSKIDPGACSGPETSKPDTEGNGTGTQGGNTTAGTNTGAQGGNQTTDSDRDGDGLSDTEEITVYGTNPDLFDTDSGGVGDGEEVANATNPFDSTDDNGTNGGNTGGTTQNTDRDGDGLLNGDETDFYGTDPDQADTDSGGVDDGKEVFNGTNPLDFTDDTAGNTGSDRDGDGLFDADETGFFGTDPDNADTDGDGVGDGEEVFNGTDPLDSSTS